MITGLLKKIFGSRNDRLVKQYAQTVRAINALERAIGALSDEQLRGKTDAFRRKVADGASLDEILPEAFAVVREAGGRALGMRHFDVQLIGGMVLNDGKIAPRWPRSPRRRASPNPRRIRRPRSRRPSPRKQRLSPF